MASTPPPTYCPSTSGTQHSPAARLVQLLLLGELLYDFDSYLIVDLQFAQCTQDFGLFDSLFHHFMLEGLGQVVNAESHPFFECFYANTNNVRLSLNTVTLDNGWGYNRLY